MPQGFVFEHLQKFLKCYGKHYPYIVDIVEKIIKSKIIIQRSNLDNFVKRLGDDIGIFHNKIFVRSKKFDSLKKLNNCLERNQNKTDFRDHFGKILFYNEEEEVLVWIFREKNVQILENGWWLNFSKTMDPSGNKDNNYGKIWKTLN